MKLFVEEMELQDVSPNWAPRSFALPGPRRKRGIKYRRGISGPTVGTWGDNRIYMAAREEMEERKGHCPMMVTMAVRVEGPREKRKGSMSQTNKFGPREAGDVEMRQGATGRRQGGNRKTTGKRQESGRKATGSDRQATGRRQGSCDRRATGG